LIVSRFADKKEKRDIRSIFEALDTDADGELTQEDISKGFKKTTGALDME